LQSKLLTKEDNHMMKAEGFITWLVFISPLPWSLSAWLVGDRKPDGLTLGRHPGTEA